MLPDGRRLFSATNFTASFDPDQPPNSFQSSPLSVTADTAALYHLDSSLADTTGQQLALSISGQTIDSHNLGWMTSQQGSALRFTGTNDTATAFINNTNLHTTNTFSITLEMMLYIHAIPSSQNGPLISLQGNWNASLELSHNSYTGLVFHGGTKLDLSGTNVMNALTFERWHHVHLELNNSGYNVVIDGIFLVQVPSNELTNWPSIGVSSLTLGNFDGWIDEVALKSFRGPNRVLLIPSWTTNNQAKITLQSSYPTTRFVLQTSTNLISWDSTFTNSLVNGSYDYLDNAPTPPHDFSGQFPVRSNDSSIFPFPAQNGISIPHNSTSSGKVANFCGSFSQLVTKVTEFAFQIGVPLQLWKNGFLDF